MNNTNKRLDKNGNPYPPSIRFYGPKEGKYGEFYSGETLRGQELKDLVDEITKANAASEGNGVSFLLSSVTSDATNAPAFRLKISPGKPFEKKTRQQPNDDL